MDKPFVFINVAATADGKIDSVARKGASISSQEDWDRVDRLRAESDAVMIGGKTLRDEDPRLTVQGEALRSQRLQKGLPENPMKVAIARRLDLRGDSRFVTAGPARVVLFTTSEASAAERRRLEQAGVEVRLAGEHEVDLTMALQFLRKAGVQRLMVEGGSTLNFRLIQLGLVDEVMVFVAPMILGGEQAPTLAGGVGFGPEDPLRMKLIDLKRWDDGGVLLHYAIGA
jgi:2,5-diamino-6-(ribosylamino)-4(3H)-pyrimidinone 5'-phosphate reductase